MVAVMQKTSEVGYTPSPGFVLESRIAYGRATVEPVPTRAR